jgi:hypothetical protein
LSLPFPYPFPVLFPLLFPFPFPRERGRGYGPKCVGRSHRISKDGLLLMEKAIFQRYRRSYLVQDEANHALEAATRILYEQSEKGDQNQACICRQRKGSTPNLPILCSLD